MLTEQWFGAGALIFPSLIWILSIGGAYTVTGNSVWESSGWVAPGALFMAFLWLNRSAARDRVVAKKKRLDRNAFLPEQLAELEQNSAAATQSALEGCGCDELDLPTLRRMQFLLDAAFQDLDDWSTFNVIDQFQTAALRYQIYQMMYCLGLYQCDFVPNCHAFVSEAFQRVIERSLTPKVLSFWRWERFGGKLSLDCDPVQRDNIMVTGFLLQGVMLYTANTGDMRYTKPDGLVFRLSDSEKHTFRYSLHDVQASLLRQWSVSPYVLIPCEPNWIYVMCNLQGMTGAVIYDRIFGTKSTAQLLPGFTHSIDTNFTESSGSVLPIRSELTGFTIPGICGAAGDMAAVIMGTGPLPSLARRLWAILRKENVEWENNKDGSQRLNLIGLVGADGIDTGNYRSSNTAIYTTCALAAAEQGDTAIKEAATRRYEEDWGIVTSPATGAQSLDLTKASTLANYTALTANLVKRPGAFGEMVRKGPSANALNGPILTEAQYPGVLVAKARSYTSKDLELVLYPSAAAGTFRLGVSRLQPLKSYVYGMGHRAEADENGHVWLPIIVEGRTHIHLKRADASV